jgi:hypothetical protein
MDDYLPYQGVNSLPEGVYRWNIGNLSFLAKNRVRGAGYANVLSPEFDHWDGFRVTVPKDVRYKILSLGERDRKLGTRDYACIEVAGYEVLPCPFCKKSPELQFVGSWVGAPPMSAESWYLRCCGMINSSIRRTKVTELIDFWNGKVKSV